MTSSSSYELTLLQDGQVLGQGRAAPTDLTAIVHAGQRLSTGRDALVQVRRPHERHTRGGVRLGDQLLLGLHPGQTEGRCLLSGLRDEVGEIRLVLFECAEADPTQTTDIIELRVLLDADPALVRFRDALLVDLERVHLGLVLDQAGPRPAERRAAAAGAASPQRLQLESELALLEQTLASLSVAIDRIAARPSTSLEREVRMAHWRPGDRLAPSALADLPQQPGTRLRGGRVRAVGLTRVRRVRLSTDVPEHRALKRGVLQLRDRALGLARHCDRSAALLQVESVRWSGSDREGSVFATEYRPRVMRLERLRDQAMALAERFDSLVEHHPFLAAAGAARSQLQPTPVFQNRPGYMEAYAALRRAEPDHRIRLDGDDVHIRLRSLSRLYEYWCFVRVAWLVADQLGCPRSSSVFQLVDEIYRPDLAPGQRLHFAGPADSQVIVSYEPDIPPPDTDRGEQGWRASLSGAPLRPDVVVEVRPCHGEPVALVLDAKCTTRFTREQLFSYTDYRTRIFDARTGRQPVRQVFFLHRDERGGLLESLPGYLDGERGSIDSSIVGAVPFLPETTEHVALVLARFVALATR